MSDLMIFNYLTPKYKAYSETYFLFNTYLHTHLVAMHDGIG